MKSSLTDDSRNIQNGAARKNTRHRHLAIVNWCLLGVLWVIEFRIAERHWLTVVITYVPQHLVLLATLGLLFWALWKKQKRWALMHALTVAVVLHVFIGFQIPLQSTLANLLHINSSQAAANSKYTSGSSQTQAPLALRVMSYNILCGIRGVDGLETVIRANNPDVLCMQEAVYWKQSPDPIPLLQMRFPNYHVARVSEVATFSKYPIVAQRVHPFPAPSERAVLETVLDIDGRHVRVFNVHLSTIQLSGRAIYRSRNFSTRVAESVRERGQQLDVLFAAIDTPQSTVGQSTLGEVPTLVVGDFNTPPRGLVYAKLANRFGDAWRQSGWGTGDSFASSLPVVRIDYVWTSRHFQSRRASVLKSTASDHCALSVDLMMSQ